MDSRAGSSPFSTSAIDPLPDAATCWAKEKIFSRAGVWTQSTPTTPRACSRSSLVRAEPYTALGMGGKKSDVVPSGAPASTIATLPWRSRPARSSQRYSGAMIP